MRLFHYHLVTSGVRDVEARYIGKLGFRLVGRHGRIDEASVTIEPGVSWEELDRSGFSLRATELQKGAVNIVLQPGHWRVPRLDHLGIALDEDAFQATLERAASWRLPVQQRGHRRTFVSAGSAYRLELHPPREWIDELLDASDELEVAELRLRTDHPAEKAGVLADILGLRATDDAVDVGNTTVRFLPGGPATRPLLHAERF